MSEREKKTNQKKDGVSLRTIHVCLIIGTVIFAGLMLYSTFRLSTSFRHVTDISERQIEMRKDILELMDASDYLTEQVQRFTIQGERKYLDEYFKEANETKRREDAIAGMSKSYGGTAALEKLQAAMDDSVQLMERECYAMRLVIEAKGYTEYPEEIRAIELTEADQALTSEEKMRRATEVVLDNAYFEQKKKIRKDMGESLNEVEKMVYDEDAKALLSLRNELTLFRIIIVLQTLGIIFLVWLTSRLGIHPILNAVERIKADSKIPEVGANEFRYLARTYNKMYEVYKRSIDHLNFKASHDELTGVYNRAGYDLLLSSLDPKTTYMILFDVDNFKSINDTYGHETGDKVLIKLVGTLKSHFRADDYICRIGGDEFVVFMVHSDAEQNDLVAKKIDAINESLEKNEDGLPPVSISVGIVRGTEDSGWEDLFKKTDEAMYRSKRRGKRSYTFYKQ